jgi:hypothetical protein
MSQVDLTTGVAWVKGMESPYPDRVSWSPDFDVRERFPVVDGVPYMPPGGTSGWTWNQYAQPYPGCWVPLLQLHGYTCPPAAPAAEPWTADLLDPFHVSVPGSGPGPYGSSTTTTGGSPTSTSAAPTGRGALSAIQGIPPVILVAAAVAALLLLRRSR